MPTENSAVVLYNEIPEGAAPDELDTLVQADLVGAALEKLSFKTVSMPFSLDFRPIINNLSNIAPVFVFNLTESVAGEGKLSHFAPFLLEYLQIKYSGCPAEAIYLTTNKVLTKKLLRVAGVNTPGWVSSNETIGFNSNSLYIIKPVSEDASIGLEDVCLYTANEPSDLRKIIKMKQEMTGKEFFAEEYIDGREFNLSILGCAGNPEVLPPAEIRFIDYPETGRLKIVDYKAKWDVDSFEYQNTQRTFEFEKSDFPVLDQLKAIARICWNCFHLKGYARIDFRVGQDGKPWVLEVNANPCLTPGSGLIAAAEETGLDFPGVINRIVEEI